MIEVLLIAIALLLVLACGVFVAAEFAFVTVDRTRIERLASKGDRNAKGVLSALKTLSTQLSGAQVGITVTNLAIGFLAEPAISELLRGPLESAGLEGAQVSSVAIILGITIATVVTMIFGELVPKNLAIARPVGTAKAVQGLQRGFTKLMYGPIVVMNGTANKILHRFGLEAREELAAARSVEELLSVVKHSAKRGTLARDTAILVERSIEFSERHASDVMTPRVKLETLEQDKTVNCVIEATQSSGFSRFPVIGEDIDNIVGFVSVKQAVAIPYEDRSKTSIKDIMKPALFVPSSMELDDLIEKMRDEKVEAVIAMDEFGGVDGIVTIEDLVEELVGEVKDEHDEEGVAIRRMRNKSWLISGLLRPDEVAQVTGYILPEDEEYETVGGLTFDAFDRIPKANESVEVAAMNRKGQHYDVKLTVIKMDGTRIDRIQLDILKPRKVEE